MSLRGRSPASICIFSRHNSMELFGEKKDIPIPYPDKVVKENIHAYSTELTQ
jgi:hypothetical protein